MADKKISQLTGATLPLGGTEVLPIVQSGSTKSVATNDLTVKNVRSNATTGVLQIAGPAAAATRTMTVPDANFTAARTDAAQTFTGNQTIGSGSTYVAVTLDSSAAGGADLNFRTGGVGRWIWAKAGAETGSNAGSDLLLYRYDDAGGYGGNPIFINRQNGNVTFENNIVIKSAGNGIDFSATSQAGGMTSELLSDYEEGTWTATLKGSVSDPTTPVTATGRYTRVGRIVTITASFDNVNTTGAAGDVTVTGIPFNNSTPNTRTIGVVGGLYNFTIANKYVTCGMNENATAVYFSDEGSGTSGASLQHSAGATRYLRFEMTYYAA